MQRYLPSFLVFVLSCDDSRSHCYSNVPGRLFLLAFWLISLFSITGDDDDWYTPTPQIDAVADAAAAADAETSPHPSIHLRRLRRSLALSDQSEQPGKPSLFEKSRPAPCDPWIDTRTNKQTDRRTDRRNHNTDVDIVRMRLVTTWTTLLLLLATTTTTTATI